MNDVLLRSSFQFAGLPENELAALDDVFGTARFAAGDTIVREGEPGDTCFVVASGEADVVARDLVGQEVTLQRFTAGASFGAAALTTATPRSATVRALGEVEALTFSRFDFDSEQRRGRYWRILIADIGLFAVLSFVAARSGQELAIYGALVLGSFVVPVTYVTYLAESDTLAARPLTLALTFVLGAAFGLPVAIYLRARRARLPGPARARRA